MSPLVSAHVRDDGVGELRLTRPAKRNALSHALVDEALAAMDRFEGEGVAVAVLRADPPIFCAGNDLVEAMAERERPAADRFFGALLERPLFWIAALEGPALGAGVAVAAVCPIALMIEDGWLAMPELEIGLFPAGVLPYVEPFAGPRRSLEAGLTGARIAAPDAVAMNLLTEAVAPEQLEARVAHWCAAATGRRQVTDAARRSWQARFRTEAARERAGQLQEILDAQSFATQEGQA
jgi:enoyl-CoA hydratase/carnithine racemase